MLEPLLRTCVRAGCPTLTMGELCVAHEAPVLREFVRGRPFVPPLEVCEVVRGGRSARLGVARELARIGA